MTDRESKQLLEPDEERDGKNARTRYSPFLRIFFSEFYGTFIVSMMTTGALLLSSNITNEVATVERLLMCSLTYGCSFGVAFYALSFAQSDASYGLATVNLRQLNPAVTLCVALMGVCGLGNLGPHRTHIRVGDHQVKAAAKTVQLSMALFVLIAQLCGNFVGVYFALNVISNGYELNPNISLDGVTEDMKWVSGALVSCVAILTIVAVCHHPDSKAKFLRERNVRSIREDTPLSLFEVNSLLSAGTIFACTLASCAIMGSVMDPFQHIWLSWLSPEADLDMALSIAPFLGAAGSVVFSACLPKYGS